MVRAIVGARVSSVQGQEKTSHITQRGKGQAYAESQDWTVVGVFEDLDVSAIKMSPWDRPDLKEWLERADEWDALIFAKTDRVFRSAADCVRLAEWCREHHKILVLVDDGIRLDYYHPEDARDAFAGAMSKVFLILASVFAEIEGQRFVQRARDRVAFLRGTDRWGYGVPPYGYQIVEHASGRGKALALDPESQIVLQRLASDVISGRSLTSVTHQLNERGVPSPRDHRRARAGNPVRGDQWTVDKVKYILTNPSTQGIKKANDKPVLDADGEPVMVGPASFDQETWTRLQQELAERSGNPRGRRHTTNPLLGVAKCGGCGKNMRQRSQTTPAGVTHRYYVCSGSPRACRQISVIADDAEALAYEEFLRVHSSRRVRTRVWQSGSDHSAELEQTVQTIEALRGDRALGLFTTDADVEMFRHQMTALVDKRDTLAMLPVARAGWVAVELDETYGQRWPAATSDEKRKLLLDSDFRLTIHRDRVVETYMDEARVGL